MGSRSNLEGMRFGRLVAVSVAGTGKHGSALWNCRCDCGAYAVKTAMHLVRGCTKSCGCLRDELAGTHSLTHGHKSGHAPSRTYVTWVSMISRCHGPNKDSYRYYGAAGIEVCDRWRKSFTDFLEDMGPRPDGMTIDRINGEENYRKENCRWATPSQQSVNKRQRQGTKSGVKNVVWRKNRWLVVVKHNRRSDYFGSYEDLELAALVASEARRKIYGESQEKALR